MLFPRLAGHLQRCGRGSQNAFQVLELFLSYGIPRDCYRYGRNGTEFVGSSFSTVPGSRTALGGSSRMKSSRIQMSCIEQKFYS
jgi:hypothetical protein